MKIIAIGGEPATGKTKLVTKIKGNRDFKGKEFKKILKYEQRKNIIIFGSYKGEKFDGTDRLAMNVQPIAIEFIKKHEKKNIIIIFEGDRLFNNSFLDVINNYESAIIIIDTDKKIKFKRHIDRDDTQSKVFLKGRKTKIHNIYNKHHPIVFMNNNKKDLENNIEKIKKIISTKDLRNIIDKFKKDSVNPYRKKDEGILRFTQGGKIK